MFDKRKYLYAVCNGKSNTLKAVPDEVFSSGMLGIGYSIEPSNGTIYAPCDGIIGNVAEAKHAYTITTADGVDVLVHIGVDTVKLNGEPFIPRVEKGQRVSARDVIATADLQKIREAGLPDTVIVIITNTEIIKKIEYDLMQNCTKEDALISYKIKKG